jgi:hypothetical protein
VIKDILRAKGEVKGLPMSIHGQSPLGKIYLPAFFNHTLKSYNWALETLRSYRARSAKNQCREHLWPASQTGMERECLGRSLKACNVVPAGLGERTAIMPRLP